jgi:sRNA-binding protein
MKEDNTMPDSDKPTLWSQITAARNALAELHPGLFDLETPVPFKIGIGPDLKARYPDMPNRVRDGLMKWLTRRRPYLRACTAGAARIGFDGPDGVVSEAHVLHAQQMHAERNAREAEGGACRFPTIKAMV